MKTLQKMNFTVPIKVEASFSCFNDRAIPKLPNFNIPFLIRIFLKFKINCQIN